MSRAKLLSTESRSSVSTASSVLSATVMLRHRPTHLSYVPYMICLTHLSLVVQLRRMRTLRNWWMPGTAGSEVRDWWKPASYRMLSSRWPASRWYVLSAVGRILTTTASQVSSLQWHIRLWYMLAATRTRMLSVSSSVNLFIIQLYTLKLHPFALRRYIKFLNRANKST